MRANSGIHVDMVTGEIVDATDIPSAKQQRARDRWEQARLGAISLRDALGDPQGHALMRLITDGLADTIQRFVEQDERCQAYMQILGDVSGTLSVGQRAAQALINMHVNTRA